MKPKQAQGGVTLIELVVTLVVAGIVGAMVGMFIRVPVQNYVDTNNRVRLTDGADASLRRIARDLRAALPFSVRCVSDATHASVEFFPVIGGGRYRERATSTGTGTPLQFGAAVTTFDALGNVPLEAAANRYVVVGNLNGSGTAGTACDAYWGDNLSNLAGVAGSDPTVITIGSISFPACASLETATAANANERAFGRFFVVDRPVKYVYDQAAGTISRHWGYAKGASDWTAAGAFAASATAPGSGSSAVIMRDVSAGNFTCDTAANARTTTVSLGATLSRNGDSVNLLHQVHVVNLP